MISSTDLYLIGSGYLLTDDGAELGKGDYFGGDFSAQSPVQARAKVTCKCGIITAKDIRSVIGEDVRLGRPMQRRASQIIKSMQLKDFDKLKILGIGTFGRVWIVSDKKTKQTYALKILDKEQIISHHQTKGVMREKEIMDSLKHPFIVR